MAQGILSWQYTATLFVKIVMFYFKKVICWRKYPECTVHVVVLQSKTALKSRNCGEK